MNVKAGKNAILLKISRAIVGVFRKTIRRYLTTQTRKNTSDVIIIDANDRETIKRQVVQELDEGIFQFFKIATICTHMVRIDVRDD